MRRRRLRKWWWGAKWACTLAAVGAMGVAVLSGFLSYRWTLIASDHKRAWRIGVHRGTFGFDRFDAPYVFLAGDAGLNVEWGTPGHWEGSYYWDKPCNLNVGVGVLYPLALTTIPAALLWYADRRRFGPRRCAKCGYDRAGLDPHCKCPECGATPARPSK